MKRIISMLLAAVMVLSLAACSQQVAPAATEAATTAEAVQAGPTAATQGASTEAVAEENDIWDLTGTMFPLAEPVTFDILTSGYRYADLEKMAGNKDWQALEAATNVHINWVSLGKYNEPESGTNLQMRLMSGDYGDGVWSMYLDNMTVADINEMAAAGLIVPLDPYQNDPSIMPNFNKIVIQDAPYLTTAMKGADGNIYAFYGLAGSAAYNSCEGLMQVNEAWLKSWQEAKGVDHTPATIDEFEDMLIYFAENDLNGNGEKDEIAYFIAQPTYNGTSSLEPAFGMYGIGIKDSAVDMDIMINDAGECYYVYTTDAYKEAIKQFSDWYKKDLIWKEIFTCNDETITGVVSDAENKIGVINSCYDIPGFIAVLPPTVEGYKPAYHTHPAVRNGIEGTPYGVISNKCEHPEILAAFYDVLYNFDNYLTARFGSKAWTDGQITVGADGKYVMNVPGEPLKDTPDEDRGIYDFVCFPMVQTSETLNLIDVESYFGDLQCVIGNKMYEENNIWNSYENLWPRCSILAEYSDDYTFKYTDVSALVNEYRAKFLTGVIDVDAEWDNFQNQLKALGVEDMQEIVQKSYDAYMSK